MKQHCPDPQILIEQRLDFSRWVENGFGTGDCVIVADEVLKPTAELAYEGKGGFKAGEHCQLCKVKATCRKRAEYNLELARYDFEMPATLEDTEIAAILGLLCI